MNVSAYHLKSKRRGCPLALSFTAAKFRNDLDRDVVSKWTLTQFYSQDVIDKDETVDNGKG